MKIEKAECNYQVTECDLKFGKQITLDGELLIPISVLDKIRAKIEQIPTYDQFTGESCSAYEFKSDVLYIIDKYREGSE